MLLFGMAVNMIRTSAATVQENAEYYLDGSELGRMTIVSTRTEQDGCIGTVAESKGFLEMVSSIS